jgi:hypothetical protein
MDRFKRIIDSGFTGFTSSDAREIVRNSAEVSQYVEEKRAHLTYVQQLMNDKIIDEAMGRVRENGEFGYDEENGFTYTRTNQPKMRINEQYPAQQVYQMTPQRTNDVMSRLDAMEREMQALRAENRELRSRYGQLK